MKKSGWRTAAKVILCAALFLFVLFSVLANIGGNGDSYRQVIEEYAAETTGYHAAVSKLNDMRFFPDIAFDFEDLDLRTAPESPNQVVTVESVKFAVGFWDVALSAGTIKTLDIQNAFITSGIILDKPISLEHLYITEGDNEAQGFLKALGAIGAHEFSAVMNLEAKGRGEGRRFGFAEERPVGISLGPAFLSGVLKSRRGLAILEELAFSYDNMRVAAGRLHAEGLEKPAFVVTGELTFAPYRTVVRPYVQVDLSGAQAVFSGRLDFAVFDSREFAKDTGLRRGLTFLSEVFSRKTVPGARTAGAAAAINFSSDRTILAGAEIGPASGKLLLKEGEWSFESDNATLKAEIENILN
ncbi:MAG: hypothetical protein K9G62_00995 [Alphaproteobacteria bacterium]|nr:hypothetical protein [Alphaproteobacteria bacterium]